MSETNETNETNQAENTPEAVQEDNVEQNQSIEKNKINEEVLETIPVTLSVEVGRSNLKLRDLLKLTQGSVVELDRIAGEPLDLLVNNTVVAQGEVVLVNDRYGIRLTKVVPATDRMKNVYWQHISNRHNSSGDYRAIMSHMMCAVSTSTALTGFTFFCGSSGSFECTATLYGFRL